MSRATGCIRKQGFDTKQECLTYIANTYKNYDELQIYKCQYCKHYHAGHKKKKYIEVRYYGRTIKKLVRELSNE